MTTGAPLVRRQLGRELRSLRERSGLARDDVARTRVMSRTKLENLEFGRVSVRPGDVYELCRLYGAAGDVCDRLREMAVASNQPTWWQDEGRGLSRGFDTYIGLEAVASCCHVFEPSVVEGLLQTEAYARAVERSTARGVVEDRVIDRHVRVRLGRQDQLFGRAVPLRLHVILGESALRLPVGSEEVMTDQREELLRRSRRGLVDLRVLPEAVGPHPGLLGGFRVLQFDDPADPSVVYVQSYAWARYNDRPEQVKDHLTLYRSLAERAVSIEEYLT